MNPNRQALPTILILVFTAAFGAVFAGQNPDSTQANVITALEKAQGWRLLFDGVTFAGWRGLGYDRVPEKHWVIENGAIKKVATKDVQPGPDGTPAPGGDLMTIEAFGDFELSFEWKISLGGNSGVKYNVSEEISRGNPPQGHAALGFEYQVLDDDLHEDAKNGPNRTAAGLYDLLGPRNKALRPVGEFNTARIVFIQGRGEHWLNGRKVLDFDTNAPLFAELLAKSKYRTTPHFADRRKGHIVLQDHTDAVWFRNIKVRIVK